MKLSYGYKLLLSFCALSLFLCFCAVYYGDVHAQEVVSSDVAGLDAVSSTASVQSSVSQEVDLQGLQSESVFSDYMLTANMTEGGGGSTRGGGAGLDGDAAESINSTIAGWFTNLNKWLYEIGKAQESYLASINSAIPNWFTNLHTWLYEIYSGQKAYFDGFNSRLDSLNSVIPSWFTNLHTWLYEIYSGQKVYFDGFNSRIDSINSAIPNWFTKLHLWLLDIYGMQETYYKSFNTKLDTISNTVNGVVSGWFTTLVERLDKFNSAQQTYFLGFNARLDTLHSDLIILPNKIYSQFNDFLMSFRDGVFTRLDTLIDKAGTQLADKTQYLFVPSTNDMASIGTDISNFCTDSFGILYYPFDLTLKIFGMIILIPDGQPCLTLSSPVEVFGHTIIEPFTYDFDILKQGAFSTVYNMYLSFTDFLIGFAIVRLAQRKYEEVFRQ